MRGSPGQSPAFASAFSAQCGFSGAGRELAISGPMQRTVDALVAIEPTRIVSPGELIEEPPRTAEATSRLRTRDPFNRPATNLQPPSLMLNKPAARRHTAHCRPEPPLRSGVRQGSLADSALPDSGHEHCIRPAWPRSTCRQLGGWSRAFGRRAKDEYGMSGRTLDSGPIRASRRGFQSSSQHVTDLVNGIGLQLTSVRARSWTVEPVPAAQVWVAAARVRALP